MTNRWGDQEGSDIRGPRGNQPKAGEEEATTGNREFEALRQEVPKAKDCRCGWNEGQCGIVRWKARARHGGPEAGLGGRWAGDHPGKTLPLRRAIASVFFAT